MGSGDGSLNQITKRSGLSLEGGSVSQGSWTFLPNNPDTFATGTTTSGSALILLVVATSAIKNS